MPWTISPSPWRRDSPLWTCNVYWRRKDQWLPVDWPRGGEPTTTDRSDDESQSQAGTIGGLVARGISGGLRQRHLGIRDQIIGIGLLRSDGTAAKAGGRVVKNVAGYDLMRLLCGSWGSLALITEVTLRVQPIRPAHAGLFVSGELANLEGFRAALLLSTLTPERCDWQCPGDGQLGTATGAQQRVGPSRAGSTHPD